MRSYVQYVQDDITLKDMIIEKSTALVSNNKDLDPKFGRVLRQNMRQILWTKST